MVNPMKGKQIRPIIQNMTDEEFSVLREKLTHRKQVPEKILRVIVYMREGKSPSKIHEMMGWKYQKHYNWIANKIAKNYAEYLTLETTKPL